MSQPVGFQDKVNFIWQVADLLRGNFRPHEYGQIVLPFTVLRRLECALEPTKDQVLRVDAAYSGPPSARDAILKKAAGKSFYNTSPQDLTALLADAGNVGVQLQTYINGFSPDARDVLEKYGMFERIRKLNETGLTYQIVAKFAEIDLAPEAVPNTTMGYIFEELLRRFNEMSNETAGEHFTPREVIRLMVHLLFVKDPDVLTGTKQRRSMYDPACGTGGMLTVAQEYLAEHARDAELRVYGQELNPESWATARSDMMITDQDPEQIVLGNSLTDEDGHYDRRFDYMLANPPFGVDWKKYQAEIKAEADQRGFSGRYGAGLPRVSDGSFLFLQHMLSKMKPVQINGTGGTRLAIVFSGSPLFAGGAGGGESEIRRWIIENDWLEGIVALPDQMFYNTGISTYFWILTNHKKPEHQGKIVLLDARGSWTKMRKSLGDKRKTISVEQIDAIVELYDRALDPELDDKRVKIFDREVFGYQRVTVERPLRRRWVISPEALDALVLSKPWLKWADECLAGGTLQTIFGPALAPAAQALAAFGSVAGQDFPTESEARTALGRLDVAVPAAVIKELLKVAAVADPAAPIITDRKGNAQADPDLRDQENITLPAGFLRLDAREQALALYEQAEQHLADEIKPYAADAWIEHDKAKIGYEIPFTRRFYEYVPPRPLAEIDAELAETERQIQRLLGGLVR